MIKAFKWSLMLLPVVTIVIYILPFIIIGFKVYKFFTQNKSMEVKYNEYYG